MRLRTLSGFIALATTCAGCGPAQGRAPRGAVATPASAGASTGAPPSARSGARAGEAPRESAPSSGRARRVLATFSAHLAARPNLSFDEFAKELSPADTADRPLSFDPTSIRYYDAIARALELTPEEIALYKKSGVVKVDHQQRYTMANAYFAIYARDLPVLVTTDSILHALHRSFDDMLMELEASLFAPSIDQVLTAAHEALAKEAKGIAKSPLSTSAADVDIYLTVARNLLGGQLEGPPSPSLKVASKLGNDRVVSELLERVQALTPDPIHQGTEIYGGKRAIDYSQFKPRGHYAEFEKLRNYFRALMWLGRADLGFNLSQPDPVAHMVVDTERELRDAALLTLLIDHTNGRKRLGGVSDAIDFLVGRADNLTPEKLAGALSAAEIRKPGELADAGLISRLKDRAAELGAQQIRSQALGSNVEDAKVVKPPSVFQLFGQRFILDSFVLSQVVFDSIVHKGVKQERMMPSGRDVMAALGNDEAARLLEPDLRRYNYTSNLVAARKVVSEYEPGDWEESVYGIWLDALRTLDDAPTSRRFPESMRGRAFGRKQLETQLASWAELRHDTILYGKQSYGAVPLCEYPAGYVEPYPAFFERIELLAEQAAKRLEALDVGFDDPDVAGSTRRMRDSQSQFFNRFSETAGYLARLAKKELSAIPFTDEEAGFLKKTIDMRGGGSGGPRYDGWYTRLFYSGEPMKWKPSVADVHTDPASGQVLEVGVGDVNFLVVAIDNDKDRAAYVGPSYSYYEFTAPQSARMTDEEWQARISGDTLPPRPAWTSAFRAKPKKRTLPVISKAPTESDPRVKALGELYERMSKEKSKEAQDKLRREVDELNDAVRRPPPAAKETPKKK